MAPSSQPRPTGLPGGSTTIAIILVLVVPSLMLVFLCVARRMPWFEPIRQRARAVVPRFTRQPGAAGPESLQSLPVVKYDEKLFNSDPEGGGSDGADKLTTEGRARTRKQLLQNVIASFNRLEWPVVRFKGRGCKELGMHKKSVTVSPSEIPGPTPELLARKLAMQACAICTEDFCKGTNVRKLPCGHIFHPRCIDPWLVNFAATCPLCRIDLSVKEATSRVSKPRPAGLPRTSTAALSPPATPAIDPTVTSATVPTTDATTISSSTTTASAVITPPLTNPSGANAHPLG